MKETHSTRIISVTIIKATSPIIPESVNFFYLKSSFTQFPLSFVLYSASCVMHLIPLRFFYPPLAPPKEGNSYKSLRAEHRAFSDEENGGFLNFLSRKGNFLAINMIESIADYISVTASMFSILNPVILSTFILIRFSSA
jgi:hypothetical protein